MIIVGDCIIEMRKMEANSISCIVCDPPYMIGFMNKSFDKFKDNPAANVEVWKEALRICKPGANLLAFGGDRTHHHLMVALENAGWTIKTCIYWITGQGFPKSCNFGKKIGGEWAGYGTALKPAAEIIVMCMKPVEKNFAHNAEKWGVAGINIDSCRVKRDENDVSGWSVSGSKESENGSMSGKNYEREPRQDYAGRWPANLILSEEAGAALDEMTSELKSAHRNRTNHKSHRDKGDNIYSLGMNIDKNFVDYADSGGASRFFFIARNDIMEPCQLLEESSLCGEKMEKKGKCRNTGMFGNEHMGLFQPDTIYITKMETHSTMNFPIWNVSRQKLIGNCMLESERIISQSEVLNIESVRIAENLECLIRFQNEATEPIKGIVKNVPQNAWLIGEKTTDNIGTNTTEKDEKIRAISTTKNTEINTETGSIREEENYTPKNISRFFYCPKASSRERQGSKHPTIKPKKLIAYLIKLIAPPGDPVILDPFMGSGTTGIVCKELGYRFIGIEKDKDYFEDAKRRINLADAHQCDLFDSI